jgi:hypothetical protein
VIGEHVAAGMPQLRMHPVLEPSSSTEPRDHHRSDVNTNDDGGFCSRLSRRKAPSSRPDSGCTEAAEPLTRLTCKFTTRQTCGILIVFGRL